jgi:hypothetical protein
MIKKIIFVIIFTSIWIQTSHAGNFKFRAREHYELHTIKLNSQNLKYSGLSNTINFWYEKPRNYSIGLFLSPIIGKIPANNKTDSSLLGDNIQILNIGSEFKKYISIINKDQFFYRTGLSWIKINSEGTANDLNGLGMYLGFGYEFIYKKVGIAPEFAIRYGVLERNNSITSITPSIGFHFY